LQEIIQTNRKLADKLDNMVPTVQIIDNSDKEMYIKSQISKFNKKENLLEHMKSKEFNLPSITRQDRSVDSVDNS